MDVAAWLRTLGLEQYEQAFRDNAIDAEVLPELTEADLEKLGILLGHRKKLLKAIAALRPTAASAAAPAPFDQAPDGGYPAKSAAERRQLTVLFCDLVSSTELAAKLDPEELREIISAYHRRVAEAVGRFEGHVAKYMGDGVLAYFGYPRAHEDDAERAVRAGLAIIQGARASGAREGALLPVRIGIATGLVVVGDLIGEGAAREEAVGGTLNMAARLQAVADPNSIVISRRTRRLVGGLFELADLGTRMLRGSTEPVRAWRVLGPSRAEGRFEALHEAGLTPLVGREHELGLLLDRWERAKEGEGQVVLLSGEPGIGKSRLIRALRERLAEEPHTPLSHFCSPYYRNTAFYPVIALLERAAGLSREDPPTEQLDKLEALLALAVKDVKAVASLFADLLAIPAGERYPPLDFTPQRKKDKTLEALIEQMEGLAAREPVLTLYEDVHWIDPSTLDLLGRVIDRVQRLRVLLVITFRPEFTPPWTGHAHVTALSLSRLGRRQGAAMIERVTGGKALPDAVLDQIIVKTDGVPLFVEELTKAVLESGLLHEETDGYVLAGPLPPLAIPATLQDSLMARLDRLAPVKEVAQIGAAIGREFSYDLLAAVAPMTEMQLSTALAQLTQAELLFARGTPPEASYTFKHALVQETAYASLLRGRRHQLHQKIASLLETRFPETVVREPELLAHHLTEAGASEEAILYWQKAGERAVAASANREAIAQLTRGLRLLDNVGDGAKRCTLELHLRATLGPALIAAKGYSAPETEACYLRARELVRRGGDPEQRMWLLWGLFAVFYTSARPQQALEVAEELLEAAEQTADAAGLSVAHRSMAGVLILVGRFAEAHRHAERAAALYDPERHAQSLVHGHEIGVAALSQLALALWHAGYPEQASGRSQEALALAEQRKHANTTSYAAFFAGILLAAFANDMEALARHAERLIACARQHELSMWLAYGEACRGASLVAEGKPGEAARRIEKGIAALHSIGATTHQTMLLNLLARSHLEAGDAERAIQTVRQAHTVVAHTCERYWEAELWRAGGEASQIMGKPVDAEECLSRAVAVARDQGSRMLELRAATSLARLWQSQARKQEAHDLLAPIYGWFTEGFDTPDLREAKALLQGLAASACA